MRRILVTDASVVVDLLARFAAEPIETALFGGDGLLVAPELLDIEVLHILRKLETTKAIPASRRARVLDDFRALPIRRFRHAMARRLAIEAESNSVRRLLCSTGASVGGNPGYPGRADRSGSGHRNQRRAGLTRLLD